MCEHYSQCETSAYLMRILMLVQITAAAAAAVDADSVACLPAATFYPVSIENLIDSTRNKSPHTYTHIQATHTLSAISKDNTKSKSNQRQSMHNNSHFKLQPMTKLYELILLFIRICTRSKYTFRHTHRFFCLLLGLLSLLRWHLCKFGTPVR